MSLNNYRFFLSWGSKM